MRIACLFYFFIFTTYSTLAQTGCVTYQRILNRDSVLEKDLEGMPAILVFNAQQSLFTYGTTKLKEAGFYDRKLYCDSTGHVFFKDLTTKRLVSRERFLGDPYLYEETLPSISWRLTPETRKIGNFSCQKAVTHFRGRDYEAWFTAEIPVRSGPWKFHGLPGLILEITSTNKEIQFLFVGIEMPISTDYQKRFPIYIPTRGQKVTSKDYLERYHTLQSNIYLKRLEEARAKGLLDPTDVITIGEFGREPRPEYYLD